MRRVIVLSLLAALYVPAWAAVVADGEGDVLDVNRTDGAILIQHGDIPNMMGPMTMEFSVDNKSLLEGINVGDRVTFSIQARPPFDYVLTRIELKQPGNSE